MPEAARIVVWIPSGDPGWDLEGARPYHPRSIGGGLRTLYEIAAALAVAGRRVELRGVYSPEDLTEVCSAAGAWPELPAEPRAPEAFDAVIVPEGIDDPEMHARLALSPARVVLMMLGPPGLFGWSFADGWSPPDPLLMELDEVARPEHFRGAASLGYELWTHSPGLQASAEAAGVACRFVGNGVPGGYPATPRRKDLDVVWLRGNRWAPLARPAVRRLEELRIECTAVEHAGHREVIELFGRARVVLHPVRIEGHSRIASEARGMGAVPVVLASNRFGVGLDEENGAVAVDDAGEVADAVVELLRDPARLERLSAAAVASARRQVDWESFVERVDAAVAAPPAVHGRGALGAVGDALRERALESDRTIDDRAAERDEARADLDRHRDWLEATNSSLSWRATAPLRMAKRSLTGSRPTPPPAPPPPDPLPATPRGRIVWPPGGGELVRGPVDLHGWCLFPGSAVARVEVSIDDGKAVLARPSVEAPPDAPDDGDSGAPLCGFEYKPDLASLPPGGDTVRVDVTAHALDGRKLTLEPVTYTLVDAPPAEPPRDVVGEPRTRPAPRPVRAGGEMRLVAFTHMLSHGGASLYLLELLRRLRRAAGIRCEVVSLVDGPLRALLEDAGIPVHLADPNAPASAERYESHVDELAAWVERGGFDAVLVNTLGGFAGADIAARLRLPVVWAVHESFTLPMFWFNAFPPSALDPHVRDRAEEAFRAASAVLFVADATRRLFLHDADPARLITLPYGLELGEIDAARRSLQRRATRLRLGIDPDVRVVLCLGSIEPRKSQAMLAQAFAHLAGRHPDARLVLVGATDDAYCADYRAALREYRSRAGLTERIRIEPVTDDPWSWHAVADLVVCASDIESLPRSLTEAMAFGTPVLSTRVFGVPELIQDGVDGFMCDMRDVGDLAAGLDRVLNMDAAELAAVARAGSGRVRARHDPVAYADDVARLLEGLVAQPDALPGDLLAGTDPSAAEAAS